MGRGITVQDGSQTPRGFSVSSWKMSIISLKIFQIITNAYIDIASQTDHFMNQVNDAEAPLNEDLPIVPIGIQLKGIGI